MLGRVTPSPAPPSLGSGLTKGMGFLLRDVVLTREEIDGLMAGWLTPSGNPSGLPD